MVRRTAKTVDTKRPLGLVLLAAAVLSLCSAFFAPAAAHAVECTTDPATACVQGTIKQSDGSPAEGIELSITGEGLDETVTTDATGHWAFTVTQAGTYTVTVNQDTLPEGQYLKSADSREINAELGRVGGGLFPLTDTEPGAQPTPTPGENGETAAPPPSSSAGESDFSWSRLWQQTMSGLRLGLLIALASLGLSLIYGTTGLSNFAHGEMVSLGGLSAALFMGLTGNLWLSGLLAVIVLAAFGWVQEKVLWKPLRKRRLSLMQLMIVSIGLSIAMQFAFQFFFGTGVITIDPALPKTVNVLGAALTVHSLIAMGVAILAIILVGIGLMYTRFGRATRAISDNPALAQASGIDVDRVISIVWIVGGGLAGLSGVFLGLVFNGLTYFMGGQMLLLFFAAVILGGLGTAFGAFIGSMIVGMMVELTNIWLPGDLKYGTALLLLILILLVRPQGIFGRKERIG